MVRTPLKYLKDVMNMARRPPIDPLIVVCGATGTGKSQLAVELAKKYNGEVINGDAMQMYNGLPIITNKITVEEQHGIPHHLLGIVGLEEEPWTVGIFKKKAGQIISEIRARGRLPILVGGTHYYTQSLLFNDTLVSKETDGEEEVDNTVPREDINKRWPILERPTEEILEELKKIDPIMADRWHPNDRRKIQRSLEIYLMSGEKASEVYQKQKERRIAEAEEDGSLLQSTLLFWVHADPESLKARLDSRVDAMVENGLINEVKVLDSFKESQKAKGTPVDQSRGIWVSIGYKEFEPYLSALQNEMTNSTTIILEAALADSIERTKAATRQYAKRQVRWIRLKLLSALSGAGEEALNSLYLLDGSNVSQWSERVSTPAMNICGDFLSGRQLSLPASLSTVAEELLAPKRSFDFSDRPDLWIRQVCELCHTTAVTELQWQDHLKSRSHRRAIKKLQKAAHIRPSIEKVGVTEEDK